ncbi:twitching motility protein PilT [Litchfieldella qijiaojingensis]|uniref:Ribonuclease VapC n=1 Tax=Litchfieldella qijiaojingensis TaxID=980347 RepID=A0ABQ2Z9T3_9GAMM|nr:type II toxin-antitoxin system VapC family toxin [Halomonas qijiaojingensis]GGY09679.1 twitching motility protein PilT [Halomonas qijiaojingensis]
MYLCDTNVVSELRKAASRRADPYLVSWASQVAPEYLFLSVITVLELELGILRKEREDAQQGKILRRWLVEKLLPAFEGRILPITVAVAQRCAALHVPDPKSERDALIAATAIEAGMMVVTRNIKDFEATGVSLINPWEHEAGN